MVTATPASSSAPSRSMARTGSPVWISAPCASAIRSSASTEPSAWTNPPSGERTTPCSVRSPGHRASASAVDSRSNGRPCSTRDRSTSASACGAPWSIWPHWSSRATPASSSSDAPPGQRGQRQRAVARVAVGHAEDAGAPVARPTGVERLELLEQQHVVTVAGQVPGRGRSHGPAADDDDLVVEHRADCTRRARRVRAYPLLVPSLYDLDRGALAGLLVRPADATGSIRSGRGSTRRPRRSTSSTNVPKAVRARLAERRRARCSRSPSRSATTATR